MKNSENSVSFNNNNMYQHIACSLRNCLQLEVIQKSLYKINRLTGKTAIV